MTARTRRLARTLLLLLLGLISWSILPPTLFLIGVYVVSIVAAFAYAGHWYERAVIAESDRIGMSFEVVGLKDDLAAITREYDAVLLRLSEVLDEHALCPIPVDGKPAPLRVVPNQRGDEKR